MQKTLNDLYKDEDWKKFKNVPHFPLGAETKSHFLIATLAINNHFIVGGKRGSGESEFIQCMMEVLVKTSNPKHLKFVLIDLKRGDLYQYRSLKNLLKPVVTSQNNAERVIRWCLKESRRRVLPTTDIFVKTKKMENVDRNISRKYPKIVIVINGYSDLVKGKEKFFEDAIYELSTCGFANFNLIVFNTEPTQGKIYPKHLVNTFTSRLVFKASQATSKILIGKSGAEKIKNHGMLYYRNFNFLLEKERKKMMKWKPFEYKAERKTYKVEGLVCKR